MSTNNERISYCFYLLAKRKDFLRASDLAEFAHVTERTIKNDIKDLEEFAEKSGAKLISKKGRGYCLLVVDDKRLEEVTKQLFILYETSGLQQNEKQQREIRILKEILCEEEYITTEELAERLYLTKSAIREEMKTVNQILNQFHLRWKKKNEKGSLVIGDELERRMLMLYVYGSHYHEAINDNDASSYSIWFCCGLEKKKEVRHIFLRILRNSECHVRDERTETLSLYLILMKNRRKEKHCILFSDAQRKIIRQFRQTQVSYRIFYELAGYEDYQEVEDDEILAFGLLLAMYADISSECSIEKHYPMYIKEALNFIQLYDRYIQIEYGITLSSFPEYQRLLMESLIPVLIQKDFEFCQREVRISYFRDARIKNSPLAAQMGFDASSLFKKEYGIPLSLENALSISTAINSIMLSVKYDFKPIRALMYSFSGLRSAVTTAKLIKKRYGEYFEFIEPHELYEMRGFNPEEYDCCFLVLPREEYVGDLSYKYEWPYMQLDTAPTQKQMNELYNRFVLNGVQLKEAYSHLQIERVHTYQNVNFQSLDSLIDLISFKSGKDAESIQKIQKSLRAVPICTVNNTCVMFIKRKLVEDSIFDYYQLKSDLKIGSETVSCVLVISCEFDGSFQSARLLNDVLYMLLSSSVMLEKLMKEACPECLLEIARESLIALPITL